MTTLEEYYNENHEYEFLVNSWNLYSKSGIKKFLEDYDIIKITNLEEKNKKLHDLRASYDLDEFNFSMIIRLTIVLEFALKGIAISKKINIFDSKKDFSNIEMNDNLKSYGFDYFINNLFSLLNFEQCSKYKKMLKFFQKKRNLYIHFSKKEYLINHKEIIINFRLLEEFMEEIVLTIKEKTNLNESQNTQKLY